MGFFSSDNPMILSKIAERRKITDPDTRAEEFRGIAYPHIESGLRGEGLFPEQRAQSIRDMLAATTEEYGDIQKDLPGMLARTVTREDVDLRDFIRRSIDASYARRKENIRDEDVALKAEEKNIAQNLALNALATEKGVATRITQLTNQSMLRRAGAPSFGSELFGGLGGMAGIYLGSQGRGGQATAQVPQVPQIGGASVFSPSGSTYLSEQWLNPASAYFNTASQLT